MRVIICPLPASSHVYNVAPLAWALQNAGHDVVLATQPSAVSAVLSVGQVALPVGDDVDLVASPGNNPDGVSRIVGALDLGADEGGLRSSVENLIGPSFTTFWSTENGTPIVEAFTEAFREWAPDLVVWDSGYFPAGVAATRLGIRHVRYLWGRDWTGWMRARQRRAAGDPSRTDELAALTEPLLRGLGLEFDERVLLGEGTVDPKPEAMRWDTGLDYLPVRWTPYTGSGVVPGWLSDPAPGGRVALSLGVSFREFLTDDDLPIAEMLRGIAGLGVEVVATVDERQVPPDTPLPDAVRCVDFVPLSALVRTCSVLVHHGGTGTWGAGLAHGVPQVVVARDQIDYPAYGELTAARGAGVHVPVTGDTGAVAAAVVDAVADVLGDPSYRRGARALREEVAAAPSPAELVGRLEKLVVTG